MIKLVIWKTNVTLNNGEWGSNNRKLNSLLKYYTYIKIRRYTPFLDLSLAELVISDLGGEIIEITNRPEFVEGRIY